MYEFKRRVITYEVLKTEKDLSILKQKVQIEGKVVSPDYFVTGLLIPELEDWVVAWRFDSYSDADKFFENINN